MATFGTKFLDTLNKSKAQDCKRGLLPEIFKVNQWYTREIREIIYLAFCQISKNFPRLKASFFTKRAPNYFLISLATN